MADSDDDEETPRKKEKKEKKSKKDKKEKKEKKKDKKRDKGDGEESVESPGSSVVLDGASVTSAGSLDGGSSTELSPRSPPESPREEGEEDDADDGHAKKKKDKKKKKRERDTAEGDAEADDGGKKSKKKDKKKDKKEKEKEKESDATPRAASPDETPRTAERNFENALAEELKTMGLDVTDRAAAEQVVTPSSPPPPQLDSTSSSTLEGAPLPSNDSVTSHASTSSDSVVEQSPGELIAEPLEKDKQPLAVNVATLSLDVPGPTTSAPTAEALEEARIKEAKARSMKLRADARMRRAAEVAARKEAENSRIRALEAASQSILSIQTILSEGTITDEGIKAESPPRQIGAINAKKYPITASRGLLGQNFDEEGFKPPALTAPHPPPNFPPTTLPRPSAMYLAGSATSTASSHTSPSPSMNSPLRSVVDPQLDYHMLQVNAMADELSAAAEAAAAAAAAIAMRAAALQQSSPRGLSHSPTISHQHVSPHEKRSGESTSPNSLSPKAIKFKLPEDDPLLHYSPSSKLKTAGGSALSIGGLTGKLYAGKSYDELPSREELRTLPSIGQRNGSAEGDKVKKKPLWLRLQEKQQLMDAQAERKRNEDYIRYKLERAKAQPTKEEIEEHMRTHDETFYHKQKRGGDKRVLKNAVNNDPFDLVYRKAEYLAEEERLLSEARRAKLKRREDKDSFGSPTRTKSNLRAIEEIERRKDQEFLASEEKRLRLQRKKEFSEQVRDTFLPASSALSRNSHHTDNVHQHSVKWGSSTGGMSDFSQSQVQAQAQVQARANKMRQKSDAYAMDAPCLVTRKVSHKSKDVDSTSTSNRPGSEWVSKLLETDKEERLMADVYEVAFSSLFPRAKY